MNIIVCVKQVPDTTDIKINPETNTLIREGVPSIINPFDEFAVEEALRLRTEFGGYVAVVSMGPPQAKAALEKCILMGADEGVLLTDSALIGSDTLTTAYALSCVIKQLKYDIIICGLQAIDGDTAQVGPEIAENLGISQITYVKKINADKFFKKLTVHRETENGYEVIEAKLPILLSVTKGINIPRSVETDFAATLALSEKIKIINLKDIDCPTDLVGIAGSPTQVIKIYPPIPRKRRGITVDSNLPPHERLRIIMSGGLKTKEDTTLLDWKPDSTPQKIVDYLKREKLILNP